MKTIFISLLFLPVFGYGQVAKHNGGLSVSVADLRYLNITGNALTATTATNLAAGSAGYLPYQTGAGATSFVAGGTAGYFLKSGGTTAPNYSTVLFSNGTNIGVGTSSPTDKLHVNGSATIVSTLTVNGNAFSVGGSTLVVTGGKMGIGMTPVTGVLDINGITNFPSGSAGILSWGARTGFWAGLDGTHIQSTDSDTTDGIKFHNRSGTAVNIMLDSGNVGIGTTAPAQKLDVAGNVNISTGSISITGMPTDGTMLCGMANGVIGKCSVAVVGVACTCVALN